ncbi:MAG: hypothetical protein C5B59_13650 [Bacteroidetes bacterium]|nr:MAG: hypothetical protein C5B59_13650 [Bacteroidota bacterium]
MTTKRHRNRPEGENWLGLPLSKRHILQFAKRCTRPDGTIDKEAFASLCFGIGKDKSGEFTDVRKISLQRGYGSETESAGKGRQRRQKRRG